MAIEYVPLNGNVVVKVHKKSMTDGGIALPDEHDPNADEKAIRGTVEAVGYPRTTMNGAVAEMHVRVKDRVVFNKSYDSVVLERGEDYLLYAVGDTDIIAIEKGDAK